MNTLVIDTSVFVKWLSQNNEQDLENADKILQDVKNGQAELIVPELIKYEVGNVLLKGKQLTPNQAHISFGTAYSLPITFIADSEQQAKDTYSLAYNLGINYYDASFMSLAKQYNATLVTNNIKHQGKDSTIKVVALKDY
ncbi:type II toxin-antitoxin system VapC family toxin [Candidatus Daviesbacteria bacterium]|nr:type II toxin-antitoxin system VapC family toxin [Candidatus Daviesbacteria bacterium]